MESVWQTQVGWHRQTLQVLLTAMPMVDKYPFCAPRGPANLKTMSNSSVFIQYIQISTKVPHVSMPPKLQSGSASKNSRKPEASSSKSDRSSSKPSKQTSTKHSATSHAPRWDLAQQLPPNAVQNVRGFDPTYTYRADPTLTSSRVNSEVIESTSDLQVRPPRPPDKDSSVGSRGTNEGTVPQDPNMVVRRSGSCRLSPKDYTVTDDDTP
jgi:hypothetical protein